MQIDVIDTDAPAGLITFRYGDGPVVGRWRGGGDPRLGPMWVELDVKDVCRWGLDIQIEAQEIAEGFRPGGIREAGCIVVGRCEQLTHDDVLIISVLGFPLMVETTGEAPTHIEGRLLSVHACQPEIYPDTV
jgi:hypothetical protein